MIIYIEVFLITNILIFMLSIMLIKEITYVKISKLVIIAFFINIIYLLLFVYKIKVYLYVKPILPIILIYFSFKPNLFMFVKLSFIYYFLSFILGGISSIITISGNIEYFIILILFFTLSAIIYLFFKRKDLFIQYEISFTIKGEKCVYKVFLDTGCNMFYKGLPVIVLNKCYDFMIYSEDYIKIDSGLSSRYEKAYYIKSLYVNKCHIECYCVFLDIEYAAIIGNNVF